MSRIAFLMMVLVGVTGCGEARRTTTAPQTVPEQRTAADRDNTEVNVRDRSETAKTPIDQNENQKDINITADIRKQIVDSDMSVNAHNVKIITQNGFVTLRGPVKSVDEKKRIEEIATQVAGAGKFDNQLEVEANP